LVGGRKELPLLWDIRKAAGMVPADSARSPRYKPRADYLLASQLKVPAMASLPFDFGFLDRFAIPLKRFDAGEKIFLEEDTGEHMFLVLEGKVNIVTFGTVLENVGLHGIFGEMALIDDAPRSAAAIAAEPTEVAIIGRKTFLDLVRESPEFSLYVMRALARRIRRMNKEV
jgi:CRP-like cAMP-binding protein